MVFSSLIFLFIFLPLVLGIYYFLPKKFGNHILLVFSLFFYAWGEPVYILLMIFSVIINFYFGSWIHSSQEKGHGKKLAMAVSVSCNLLLLGSFKYLAFTMENMNLLLKLFSQPELTVINLKLPIGISFYTFHAISYLVDIYRKNSKYQDNIYTLGLYLALFPQLVAGPIIRYHYIEHQLDENNRNATVDSFSAGIKRFILGLGKKMLIANQLGEFADIIFNIPPGQLGFTTAWIGAICYTLQIYFDFSGYSCMAIGLGKMFGFDFPENFNYPYISTSIQDFWRRWHITLSSWFRDYVYIPLGGNRAGQVRLYMNQVTVFFLCGLWHGASWTFVIWGLYHGFFLVLHRTKAGFYYDRMHVSLKRVFTMIVVIFGWVFFRSETLPQALHFIKAMTGFQSGPVIYPGDMRLVVFFCIVGAIGSVPMYSVLKLEERLEKYASLRLTQEAFIMIVMLLCTVQLIVSTYNPFIYFRF